MSTQQQRKGKPLNIRLEPWVKRWLEKLAAENGLNVTAYITSFVVREGEKRRFTREEDRP